MYAPPSVCVHATANKRFGFSGSLDMALRRAMLQLKCPNAVINGGAYVCSPVKLSPGPSACKRMGACIHACLHGQSSLETLYALSERPAMLLVPRRGIGQLQEGVFDISHINAPAFIMTFSLRRLATSLASFWAKYSSRALLCSFFFASWSALRLS